MRIHRFCLRASGRPRLFRSLLVGLVALTCWSTDVVPAYGQQQGRDRDRDRDQERAQREVQQRLGRSVSQAEIIEQLRQSGMTRSQIRARLQQMGYDPGLADRYFDVIEKGGEPPRGEASNDFLRTMRDIGVSIRGGLPDTIPEFPDTLAMDSLRLEDRLPTDSLAPGELPIFGRDLFQRATSQFQPVTSGPVDPDYRLGVGDQVVLILTGDVEAAYTLDVTRDGSVVIPDVGQMVVNGLTLRELEDRLHSRLRSVYSGIGRSASSTAHFQVSLGRLRNNQVFIIGEVERPGAYQVNSVATVFNALYQARGPNKNGSFRRIEVRRAGQVVRTVDIYDYLLRGDSRDDIRLEQGDVIFVPVVGPQVSVRGAVRRPAIFELSDTDGMREVLAAAGGLEARAVLSRIQIDRIVPASARTPGVDRVLVDVDVGRLMAPGGENVALGDGDVVEVFTVSAERRNRLHLDGEVRRPGVYEWAPGITLWTVIQRAEGLDNRAFTPRAHVFRLNLEDGTRRLIRTPLLADESGRPLQDVELADRDSVVIYSREKLSNPAVVSIDGFVRNPGEYTLAEGMTVRDLVLAAGGFIVGANTAEADIARLPDYDVRTDTTAHSIRVRLDEAASTASLADGDASAANYRSARRGLPEWFPSEEEVELQDGDRVFIRRAPGYEAPRTIQVTGQVGAPGTYVLQTRQERLLDVLNRVGGLTPEAFPDGLQLQRDGKLVATDLRRALRNPSSQFNLVLERGDSIHVPELDPTVLVTGAVNFEARVLYAPGRGMDYYVSRAGGYADGADKGRVSVTYQDGERLAVTRRVIRRAPPVQPGATIFVPSKPEGAQGFNWDQALTRTLTIVSTTVTTLVMINQLK